MRIRVRLKAKRKRALRKVARGVMILALLAAVFVGARWGSGNFGAVDPGRIYRSAQPSAATLPRTIRAKGIRTVVNLRGANPDQPWYAKEKAATLGEGATLVDFPMSSDQWLSREQVRTLVHLIDEVEYPILVHCEWGAERTGLVSALLTLLREGSTLQDGYAAFSPYYLFLPIKDGRVMRGHLDRYSDWLAETKSPHSPARLRIWLASEYRPGRPSREHWECNPYPLKVVNRPRVDSVVLWGSNACKVTR